MADRSAPAPRAGDTTGQATPSDSSSLAPAIRDDSASPTAAARASFDGDTAVRRLVAPGSGRDSAQAVRFLTDVSHRVSAANRRGALYELRAADGSRRLAGAGRASCDRLAVAGVLQRRALLAPYTRLKEPATTPTIDLTVHFRTPMPRVAHPDPNELCLARFRTSMIHEGFFEEDGVIWSEDGAVLIHSRQLGIVMPLESSWRADAPS